MGLKTKRKSLALWAAAFTVMGGGLALAQPHTSNYSLQSYGFGSGGTGNSGTSNYSLEGITGELSGQTATTTNYSLKPGFIETQQANVPNVTLSNPSNYYDKLKFVIDQQNNPSDALYALQVCIGSNFPCGTPYYVKSDNTISTTLALTDYQTYTAWGGASGTNIIGLSGSTTYYIRAKATQGKYTESAYGPSSSAATVGQQITFCLYTNANCGAGGHGENFNLLTGSIATSPTNIGVDFSTNADSGGSVYIYSLSGALTSTHAPSNPITSATADLSSASRGYGAQVISAPSLTISPPFNGSANLVGALSTTVQTILSASAPVSSTGSQIQLQVKADNLTPAATDYSDTLVVVAAASF